MKIHLATDHAGLELKEKVKLYLSDLNYEVIDHGAYEYDALDDYPDFIFPCANAVSNDPESKGIILGGSGQGEAMAANRVKGVRAAVFYNGPDEIIKLSRQHNNANILSLGARFMSEEEMYKIIEVWLSTDFESGRHQRRIEKLDEN
ncbi:ribose-5-phosphate isomerase [bacterium]|jgi:ribose 5-phosphate isomerase B|nr:MAG: ribose-5-phosphate isomerase [bacterium]|tara:strand:- start:175 stop:615 length:441 start_codon:yes stop_codon:yes gene_type:complete